MMDLDRKLPDVIKLYPDAKIKKIDYLGRETIHGKDIVKGIKAVKFMGAKIDSDLRLDIYARDIFCYSYFCVSFDIGGIELPKNANDFGEQIKDIEVSIDGEAGSLPLLIMKYVVPYYDVDKAIEIDKKIDTDELSELTSNLETIASETAVRPFSIIGPMSGLSVGGYHASPIIESYDGEYEVDLDEWDDISVDSTIFKHNNYGLFICTDKGYFDQLFEHNYQKAMGIFFTRQVSEFCRRWLNQINNKLLLVRESIVSDNDNSFYWRELKKTVEVMDLNFLEFHTEITKRLTYDIDDSFATRYRYDNLRREQIKKEADTAFKLLDEVKYAIRNLSTPSHTHDEQILQEETEKVNDRILMFTFVAMAVSSVGLMQTSDFGVATKVFSGLGIFSLPAIYLMGRAIQKRLLFKRNKAKEIDKRLVRMQKNIDGAERELEASQNIEDVPDDFKNEVVTFMQKFVAAEKSNLERFKKKHKLK